MDSKHQVQTKIREKLAAREAEEKAERERLREEAAALGAELIRKASEYFDKDVWDRGPGNARHPEVLLSLDTVEEFEQPYWPRAALDIICDELNTYGHEYRIEWNARSPDKAGKLYLEDPLRSAR